MRAQTLPARAGWQWLIAGLALYRRNPSMLAFMVMAYWVSILFLNVIPFLGALLASMAIPGLSVGLMQAAKNLERGQPIGLATLFGSLRENGRTLALLGAIYLLATLGILGLSAVIDGGDVLGLMLKRPNETPVEIDAGAFFLASALVMALMMPVLMAYWFAPVLAAWHQLNAGKALFFSFVACALNWRPFLTYGIGLLLLAGVVPGLLLAFLLVLFPATQGMAMMLTMVPMVLVVAPVVFASFYASYRDIFGLSEIA